MNDEFGYWSEKVFEQESTPIEFHQMPGIVYMFRGDSKKHLGFLVKKDWGWYYRPVTLSKKSNDVELTQSEWEQVGKKLISLNKV